MAYREPYSFGRGCAELGAMRGYVTKFQIAILALAVASAATAVPRYIGMVSGEGSFWVDGAGVSDHATVFEGSTVETTDAPATVQIGNAVRVLLDTNSRAQVYADHLLLERGRGQLDSGSNYRVEARTLRVMPGSAGPRAVVAISDSGAVEVGSLKGDLRVANADGVRVANVGAGNSVELRVEQGRGMSILTGCVARAGDAYLMRDEVSAVMVELRGDAMAAQTGQRVQVTGKVVTSEGAAVRADQVFQAGQVKVLERGCGTATGHGGSGSRARVATMSRAPGRASGPGVAPRAMIAGVRVEPGSAEGARAITSRGDDESDKPHKPHKPHKPPISPGR
jgi:hypothetical protein